MTSGHVFHPGHEDLHGITVVVTVPDGTTFVGRYHERNAKGVVVHDVAVFDPATKDDRAEWLRRQQRFGVQVSQRVLVIPETPGMVVERLSNIPSQG